MLRNGLHMSLMGAPGVAWRTERVVQAPLMAPLLSGGASQQASQDYHRAAEEGAAVISGNGVDYLRQVDDWLDDAGLHLENHAVVAGMVCRQLAPDALLFELSPSVEVMSGFGRVLLLEPGLTGQADSYGAPSPLLHRLGLRSAVAADSLGHAATLRLLRHLGSICTCCH